MASSKAYRDTAFLNGTTDYSTEANYLKSIAADRFQEEPNMDIRRALIEKFILEHISIDINDDELLVGRFDPHFRISDRQREEMEKADCSRYVAPSATGHRTVDYERIICHGIKSVIEEIDGQMAKTYDAAKRSLYIAGKTSLEGVCTFAGRMRDALLAKAETADGARREQLLRMAQNFEKAPYEPCTHFFEAMQCLWFIEFCMRCVEDISVTGRLDSFLYRFYRDDLDNGCLTKDFAFEIIEHLYYKHNELYGNWPCSIMVGGTDREGNTVCNELTYLCIDAIETTNLINPSVAICYTEDLPDELLARAVAVISKGCTRPSIFNDSLIVKGLMRAGVTLEDARDYIHSTCVEITPNHASNIYVATPYINLVRAFEFILSEKHCNYRIEPVPGVGPGYGGNTDEIHLAQDVSFSLDSIGDFDAFYALMKQVVSSMIAAHVQGAVIAFRNAAENQSSPLASMLIDDCIKRGLASGNGGAKYNYIYPCFPGFVNLVNGLYAIKKLVFDEKRMTLRDVEALCESNFQDQRMKAYFDNKIDKFGNGCTACDQLAKDLYDFIRVSLSTHDTGIIKFHPSYFAYVYHGAMGEKTMATPDGRLSGKALSECLGAASGTDCHGVMGVIDSISEIDQSYGIGGIATNIRFSQQMISSKDGGKAVVDLIRTFMKKDCFEMQFNVVSQQDLLNAKERPEKYRTLMVRVAGFSDYFVNLRPNVQDEIISRCEHDAV